MAGGVLDDFVAAAAELAEASGPIISELFRKNIAVDRKADRTLVTQADRDAETVMREMIAVGFPEHGFVGEEFGADGENSEYVWVIDPLDGTHAFISGLPTFGTLIALCRQGVPIVGVINQPVSGERWLGVEGRPTQFRQGSEVGEARTRVCPSLDDAILYATSPAMFSDAGAAAFAEVSSHSAVTRFGTDCYAYGLVASGHGDLVIEANMNIYDYLALVPVVAGAGGVITDWLGAPLTMGSGETVIASGDRRPHAAALQILSTAAN